MEISIILQKSIVYHVFMQKRIVPLITQSGTKFGFGLCVSTIFVAMIGFAQPSSLVSMILRFLPARFCSLAQLTFLFGYFCT